MNKCTASNIPLPAPSHLAVPTYAEARGEVLDETSKVYFAVLDEYLSLHHRYYNEKEQDPAVQQRLEASSRKLMQIVHLMQQHNVKTEERANKLMSDYRKNVETDIVGRDANMKTYALAWKERDIKRESLTQVLFQLKAKCRHQDIVSAVFILLLLIVLGMNAYLVFLLLQS